VKVKKRELKIFSKTGNIFLFVIIAIFAFSFVLASHIITTSTMTSNFSVNDSVSVLYNITINNTDTLPTQNITAVNISLPSGLIFLEDSNNSNSGFNSSYVNGSGLLVWENDGLIMNESWASFWFNATAYSIGELEINVTTSNATHVVNSTNITVYINDTTAPSIEFVSPSIVNKENVTTWIPVNVSVEDIGEIDLLSIDLLNSTFNVTNTTNTSSSQYFYNFTNLSDGVYYVQVSVNDTAGNLESSSYRQVRVDGTTPLISYASGTEADTSNFTNRTWIFVNLSVTESYRKNITFTLYNTTGEVNTTTYTTAINETNWTGLSNGTYTYNITVNDFSSNTNSTQSYRITLDSSGPEITLFAPTNNSTSTLTTQTFTFIVSDFSSVSNCSVFIDNVNSGNLTDVVNDGGNDLAISSISLGDHNWSVNCTDYLGNIGASSSVYEFSIIEETDENSGGSSGGTGSTNFQAPEEDLIEGVNKIMFNGWKMNFKVADESHSLLVDSISTSSVKITLSSTPQEAVINVGEEKKFELTGDNYYDLLVKLNSIDNSSVKYPKANFLIQRINEQIEGQITGSIVESDVSNQEEGIVNQNGETEVVSESNGKSYWWIVLLIVVLVVLFILILTLNKNKSKKSYSYYGNKKR